MQKMFLKRRSIGNKKEFNGSEEEFLAIKKFYCKEWKLNGKYHRDNGPAVIWSDGHQAWYKNGKTHRIDGPAVIRADGSEAWYQNGVYHRIDGPAVIYPGRREYWRIDGVEFSYFFNGFFPIYGFFIENFPRSLR